MLRKLTLTRGQCAMLSLLCKREPSPPATHTVLTVLELPLILKPEKLVSRLAPSACVCTHQPVPALPLSSAASLGGERQACCFRSFQ